MYSSNTLQQCVGVTYSHQNCMLKGCPSRGLHGSCYYSKLTTVNSLAGIAGSKSAICQVLTAAG